MHIPLLAMLALLGVLAACAAPQPDANGTEVGAGEFGGGIHAEDIDGG